MNFSRTTNLVLAFLLVLSVTACKKQSALEGKVVDGKGKPIAGLKIIAKQVQPIKGYEQLETTSGADGSFQFNGLYPSSKYELKPSHQEWTTLTSVTLTSGPSGETTLLPDPMMIRFTVPVKNEDLIVDSQLDLEWVVGPDRETNYFEAKSWIASLKVEGKQWRLPTNKELETLFVDGLGARNIDPTFKMTGWKVWSSDFHDTSAASCFRFESEKELNQYGGISRRDTYMQGGRTQSRVFAVSERRH
jgi:hypothetical protein